MLFLYKSEVIDIHKKMGSPYKTMRVNKNNRLHLSAQNCDLIKSIRCARLLHAFLRPALLCRDYQKMIEDFGGIHGLRDEGAMESALASAENRAYYENADIITCAATYTYHLAQDHAFIDGNKRIAAAVSEIFVEINGLRFNASNEQIVDLFMDIASGKKTRNDIEKLFLQWVK